MKVKKRLQDKHAQVHLALFVMMMVWGINLSAVKFLTGHLDILFVASIRMLIAAVVLAGMAVHWRHVVISWERREWALLLFAAFFLVYCQQIAFAAGLARTSATNASLVMTLGPAVSLAMEAVTFGRKILAKQLWGIGLSLVGVVFVVLNRPHAELTSAALGDLLILLSVFTFAMGGLCIQRLTKNSSPLSVSLIVHLAGALMLCVHTTLLLENPIDVAFNLPPMDWAMVVFSGLFATGIGSVVWSRGIATIGVGRTATYITWVPIFGVCFAALFFSEQVTLWHGVGLLGVIGGTLMVVRN